MRRSLDVDEQARDVQPPYPGGDPVVGKALRTFFIGLLNDKNL